MDTYADDLAALVNALNLKDAIHVGHSTGGGEVARYIGRHGKLKIYPGAPHGLCSTHKNKVNEDLLAFFKE